MTQRLIVGVDRPYIHDLRDEISGKQSLGADYFVAPLVDACYGKGEHLARIGSSIESGRGMESRDWITNIVGKISDWIDLDSSSVSERQASLQALQEEIAWASYLSLQAIFLPTPRFNSVNYARALMQAFTGYQQFYIRIPMLMHFQESVPTIHDRDGWLLWDGLRQHIGDAGRYFVALELCEECENISTDSIGTAFVSRWCAEPVKMLVIPTQLFQLNSAGYPVLTKRMQQILGLLLPHCSQIMLTGESTRECGSYVHYAQYLRHLVAQGQAQLSNAARHVQGYEDTLQAPLQPLMDNLEAQTYETFEKDPMKYFKYEEGITKAIQHFHKKRTLERNSNDEVILVLTVVGAGRGPLVAAALSASANTGIPLRIYAVEKNPNAVVILRSRVQSEVWSNVTVVDTDMRDWQPPELCDVMVSELLGSFGDNELSPECLDGAQKCLRSDGVSIPQSYTSYIAPIATSKLWNMAKGFNLSNSTIADGLNVAYVVRFHSSYQFAEAKPLFTFAHPNIPKEGTKIDNTRYGEVSFVSEANMVLHGLAGYFETVLFDPRSVASDTVGSSTRPPGLGTSNSASDELDRVMLSTVPQTHTEDMYSWFPLYIPLAQPVRVCRGQTVSAHLWRCVDSKKVWYEWCLSSPIRSSVQNSGGKVYSVGL